MRRLGRERLGRHSLMVHFDAVGGVALRISGLN